MEIFNGEITSMMRSRWTDDSEALKQAYNTSELFRDIVRACVVETPTDFIVASVLEYVDGVECFLACNTITHGPSHAVRIHDDIAYSMVSFEGTTFEERFDSYIRQLETAKTEADRNAIVNHALCVECQHDLCGEYYTRLCAYTYIEDQF